MAPPVPTVGGTASAVLLNESRYRRFPDLRGVQWRIDLGILPSCPSSSFDHLRRVTADSRRRYAALRRQLLVDPHVPKDGSNSPELVMDNPLSQNPDSMWGRFFKNAELERMVDQDLSRLYPEHGSYFQTPGCQGMLRRILLLWCLRNPEYGYRQGMHELLAPLLYVLHADVERLSEVRELYEDQFTDSFDGFSFHENDLTYKFDFIKFSEPFEDGNGLRKSPIKNNSFSELDPKVQAIILLSDAYGAEGELGIVLSEKFMEHDAYCMFDALMKGAGGAVAMAEFFSSSPFSNKSHTGFLPVIEASVALYHLLSLTDSSLHGHLVELGVEPQYFALRWLRVLFGREFALDDLLVIWDEIFSCENSILEAPLDNNPDSSIGVLNSSRGAFISAFAVSMILHLRSSLLATENPTSCLQRLLNFPSDIILEKLIVKAKSLEALAVDANRTVLSHAFVPDRSKSNVLRGHCLSLDSTSPRTPLNLPESYWEEKWRVLHRDEERNKKFLSRKKGWSEKVRLHLSRCDSDPSPSTVPDRRKVPKPSVRRSLLKDLAQKLGSDEDFEELIEDEVCPEHPEEIKAHGYSDKDFTSTSEQSVQRFSRGNAGTQGISSICSNPTNFITGANDHENGSGSSVGSNLSVGESNTDVSSCELFEPKPVDLPLSVSDSSEEVSSKPEHCNNSGGNGSTSLKDRKLLLNRFQWLWKFGRNASDGTPGKVGGSDATKVYDAERDQKNAAGSPIEKGYGTCTGCSKGETADQNLMVTLRNLGQSMIENIQVIESVFQEDRGEVGLQESSTKSALVDRGQLTTVSALKELRKISNLLSEL